MTTDVFSILVCLVAALLAVRAVLQLRSGEVGLRASLLWIVLWTGVALVALFPALIDLALSLTGWQSRMNIALVAAVVVLFALVSHLTWKIERLQREVGRHVQALALHDYITERARRGDDDPDGAAGGAPDSERRAD
jgi:hypothetical protein